MIPISLYIHIPWCVKKCPYCDFNSHEKKETIPENHYINCLIKEFRQIAPRIEGRTINTVFIGGGTPSLISPEGYHTLFEALRCFADLNQQAEITLEANPGTVEQSRFSGFLDAGINRLSLGVQSLSDQQLKTLGRIHSAKEAIQAIRRAKRAGFKHINTDLMFGLPEQSVNAGLQDLNELISETPTHLSWYQLTLEPNTAFYHTPPPIPEEGVILDLYDAGIALLNAKGYLQYEVSAYAKNNDLCQHNINYWEFGDYVGIGAGAHSKITDLNTMRIKRSWNKKHPKAYMAADTPCIEDQREITPAELPLEFMMNAMRLNHPIKYSLFENRTGLNRECLHAPLNRLLDDQLVTLNDKQITLTNRGRALLNTVLGVFL